MTDRSLALALHLKDKYYVATRTGMRAMVCGDVASLITATLSSRDNWSKEDLQQIAFIAASLAEDMERDEDGEINVVDTPS